VKGAEEAFPTKVSPLAEVCDNRRKLLWKWNIVDMSSTQGKKLQHLQGFFTPPHICWQMTVMLNIWLSAHSVSCYRHKTLSGKHFSVFTKEHGNSYVACTTRIGSKRINIQNDYEVSVHL
jgi:hypothetical protein